MKILYDTNVVLDVLLNRQPYANIAVNLLAAVEQKRIEGYLCATTITTIDYLLSKANGKSAARETIKKILSLFHIAAVNKIVLTTAADSELADFEDAVLYLAGYHCEVDGLVSRNQKDFKNIATPVFGPEELWGLINNTNH